MAPLLQSVELWLALGAALFAALLLSGRSEAKRRAARWQRATRRAHGSPASQAETLRKKDPNANSRFGQRLAAMSVGETLAARFETAGLALAPRTYLLRSAALGAGIAALVFALGKPPVLALLLGLIAGLGVPHLYVGRRIKQRNRAFLKLFPEAIELIVRGLRAGLPVAESFIVVSREIGAPVGEVFFTISQQTGLGVPMEKALSDAAARLDMTEFNFFVTTIILQRETGGNLGEILGNLAQVLRDRQVMKLKVGALSSEARASGYIVGALPFFVFGALSLLSPDYLRPLYDDFRGNLSLGAALGMMLLGGFIMKRMTQFEI